MPLFHENDYRPMHSFIALLTAVFSLLAPAMGSRPGADGGLASDRRRARRRPLLPLADIQPATSTGSSRHGCIGTVNVTISTAVFPSIAVRRPRPRPFSWTAG